jgi:hypothetical protein
MTKLIAAVALLVFATSLPAVQIMAFLESGSGNDFSMNNTTCAGPLPCNTITYNGGGAGSGVTVIFGGVLGGGTHYGTATFTGFQTTVATGGGLNFTQTGWNGVFQIVGTGADAGANIITVTWGSGAGQTGQFSASQTVGCIPGPNCGGSGSFNNAVPPAGAVGFTSDFFAYALNPSSAFGFSDAVPSIGLDAANFQNPYTFVMQGTFSADTLIPEPATMALMGSALLALGLWRRKRVR